MNDVPGSSDFRFTGKHMLAIMIAFFGIIIAVNLTMAFLASASWTGLVVKNSYVASQHYNQDLQRAREQKARGWLSDLTYKDGILSFSLTDREGSSLAAGNFTASIGRPAFEQSDEQVTLRHVGNSRYSAAKNLSPGIWTLQIEGMASGLEYRRDARMLVSDDGTGRLQ